MIFAAILPGTMLNAVLRERDMAPKEAATVSRTDYGQFCKMLHDIGPFDLKRVERLPYRIVAQFWRAWFFAYLDQDMDAMRNEKLVMARAEIRPRADDRRVG